MTDEQVLGLLRAVHEADVESNLPILDRSSCLSLARIRLLVLNPARRTKEESIHLDNCHACSCLLEVMSDELAHPSWWALIQWGLGRLDADKVQAMDYHLKTGECQRCLRLTESAWLKGLVKLAEVGVDIQSRLNEAVGGFRLLPTPALAAATSEREPFELRVVHPDNLLTVTLRETDQGDLVAEVETPDIGRAGRRVHVEVVGAKEAIDPRELQLEARKKGCFGQVSFGRYDDMKDRLGAECAVLVSLLD